MAALAGEVANDALGGIRELKIPFEDYRAITEEVYSADRAYIDAKLREHVGSFLEAFLVTMRRADPENYAILRPAFLQIKQKYPLRRGITP